MLPVLAAANRQKYTRCVRWLLDELQKLPEDVKQQFEEGGFVVRQRDDSVYGCAAGDYVIETQLMAPFKGKQGMPMLRSCMSLHYLLQIKIIMYNICLA